MRVCPNCSAQVLQEVSQLRATVAAQAEVIACADDLRLITRGECIDGVAARAYDAARAALGEKL